MGLTQTLTNNVEEIAHETATVLKNLDIPLINEIEYSDLRHQMRELVHQLVLAIKSGVDEDFINFFYDLICHKVSEGYSINDIQKVMTILRDKLIDVLEREFYDQPDKIIKYLKILTNIIGESRVRMAKVYMEVRENTIIKQQQALNELSTPIIPLFDKIVVVPLVGTVDTFRAKQIIEHLLNAIVSQQAEIVIIDVTGVPIIDTAVAQNLLNAAKASRLLGSTCILVGISPDMAQTIIKLDVNLFNEIITNTNLKKGLETALGMIGLEINAMQKGRCI
ncbi:STAS domain-containing protein [Desulfoscipio gibsoniae]|uniref:Anti-anti-sigma regulatory factor (Antagonist of anti-sigma factor) n=1 Tax=Desulfoscipio gibsoniae DSM 7213 TaxID=767817 RepID=R4KKM9_9FIRM|nr:STAS domain-containing protein [Desulfoscipio gibsoniae]AGL00191.1 anti-anti-sigma regulatory factor (antagonist of anti-sigma factor) [Desulfoscipio gibsoniae DSM 7213]